MFADDDRGQAIQIGAILLFSFAVVGLSVYQATVIPNQNAEVEFDHSQQVQSDMVDLRNGIVRAANANANDATAIRLGTRYPSRVFAINSAPASGRFATSSPGSISVEDDGGNSVDVCSNADETVSMSYTPSYNYYNNGPTTYYENTFVFSDFDGTERVQQQARLLFGEDTGTDDDNVVNLVAAFGDVSRAGSQPVSVDTYSGVSMSTTVTDPIIEIPTNAQASTWAIALGYDSVSDFEAQSDVDRLSVGGGTATIELVGEFEVVCTEVGIDAEPPGGVASIAPVPGGGGGSGTDISGGTATDLSGTNSQSQNFNINIGDDLSSGEQLTIDLRDTTRTGKSGITYSNPSTSSPGSVSLSGKTITYTASGSESSGDSISVTIDADPEMNADNGGGTSYTVIFNGTDSSSDQDTFSVS